MPNRTEVLCRMCKQKAAFPSNLLSCSIRMSRASVLHQGCPSNVPPDFLPCLLMSSSLKVYSVLCSLLSSIPMMASETQIPDVPPTNWWGSLSLALKHELSFNRLFPFFYVYAYACGGRKSMSDTFFIILCLILR